MWSQCALSGSLLNGRAPHDPSTDKDSRREGKAAAWLVGEWLAHRITPDTSPCGITAPNGWVVDAEMCQHVEEFVTHVRQLAAGHPIITDQEFRIGDHISGRVSCGFINLALAEAHVFGFRYGWRIIEAKDNPELLCEGIAITPPGHSLTVHVYQPRPHHPVGVARQWRIAAASVPEYAGWLHQQAKRSEAATPYGYAGAHCRDCSGRGSCQTLAAAVYAQYEVVTDERLDKMTTDQLAAELSFLEHAAACLKERIAGVEAEAEGRITGGDHIQGWEMQPRTGHRIFTVPPAQIHLKTGVRPFKEVEVTPSELERMGANKAIVKTITTAPQIGRKLARTSTAATERAFKK